MQVMAVVRKSYSSMTGRLNEFEPESDEEVNDEESNI